MLKAKNKKKTNSSKPKSSHSKQVEVNIELKDSSKLIGKNTVDFPIRNKSTQIKQKKNSRFNDSTKFSNIRMKVSDIIDNSFHPIKSTQSKKKFHNLLIVDDEENQSIPFITNSQIERENEKNSSHQSEEKEKNEEEKEEKKQIKQIMNRKRKLQNVEQFSYEVDTKGISDEIDKIIQKIESRKRQNEGIKLTGNKRGRKEEHTNTIKGTAENFGFKLQKISNLSFNSFIDLEQLSKNNTITNTDVILSIIEIAINSKFYHIDFSNKTKSFWEDIKQYSSLSKIFSGYKPETLRKYWQLLSKFQINTIVSQIKQHKNFIDHSQIKLRTLINSLCQFQKKKFDNFENFITLQNAEKRKTEQYEKKINAQLPLRSISSNKDKERKRERERKKNFEQGIKRHFIKREVDQNCLREIYGENKYETSYQKTMSYLYKDDRTKLKYLNKFKDEEKIRLMRINEDDKFAFKIIENVIDELCKEFQNYTKEFIFDVLVSNSLNIGRTFNSLKNPLEKNKFSFTKLEDDIILNMKGGKQYNDIIRLKGKVIVEEREHFLKK